MGAIVAAPIAYRNIVPDALPQNVLQALEEQRVHCVTFTSSSTVDNFAAMLGENRMFRLLQGVKIAAIGPVTAGSCRDLGLKVDMEPDKYTLENMTEEIVKFFTTLP